MTNESPVMRALSRLNPIAAGIAAGSALLGAASLALGGPAGLAVAVLASVAAAYFLLGKPAPAAPFPAAAPVPAPAKAAPPPPPTAIPADRIDPLTGLANENGLMAWFAERTPRLTEDHRGIVVLSAYLDGLEALTQKRGEAVANKVLVEVAQRVALFIGEDGIAARTGGGEFASIATVVPDHAEERASDNASNLAEMLQRPVELPEGVIWINGMVGAAFGQAEEGTGVLDRARAALGRAKARGIGHYVVDKP
jgi:diguanylate cyclase (GGDEF)-like protein